MLGFCRLPASNPPGPLASSSKPSITFIDNIFGEGSEHWVIFSVYGVQLPHQIIIIKNHKRSSPTYQEVFIFILLYIFISEFHSTQNA